ncbi:MAG: hypothetical protein ABFD63_08905 [Smithella sp.]|jgi:hypothetical protein
MQQPDIRSITRMTLPNIHQIGILVKDITEAVAYYTKLLNIGRWYRSSTVKHEAIYRGKPITPDLDIVIAFFITTTLKGLPMPHCRFIMDVGCITGDVERVNI